MWYVFFDMLTQTIAPVQVSVLGIGAACPIGSAFFSFAISPAAAEVCIGAAMGVAVALDVLEEPEELPQPDAIIEAAARQAPKRTIIVAMMIPPMSTHLGGTSRPTSTRRESRPPRKFAQRMPRE